MAQDRLVVGTRGSALALWQTEHVIALLKAAVPGLDVRVKTIKTQGDLVRDRALSQVGGKGLFVKEIENTLLTGEIDLAVHSLKDMPTWQPDGLALAAILDRAEPRDALVLDGDQGNLNTLLPGSRVGTSSLRRRAQILAARPDLRVHDLRGNVDTRLRKLHEGQYDAVILAAAGLQRLGRADAINQLLSIDIMLPAVGQGALCVEVRVGDEGTRGLVERLDHAPTRQATEAERAFLHRLQGGCQVPIGAYAKVSGEGLRLWGLVASLDGTSMVRDDVHGSVLDAAALGTALAERILAAGGKGILDEIRHDS